jgi:hypothetical protein
VQAVMLSALLIMTSRVMLAQKYMPPPPIKLDISKGLPGTVNLTGPIAISVGGGTESPGYMGGEENNQGGWASLTIEAITNMSPSKGELERLSSDSDLAAGEALGDDTFTSPLLATHVKSASVILQLPIHFTATGDQVTGPNYSCGGPVCVPAFQSDGDTGEYSARPEVCLREHNGTTLKQVKDIHDKAIKCSTANGVSGNNGYWYDLKKPWSSVVYLTGAGPKVVNWDQPQPPNPVYKGTLSIPVELPVPVNSIRVEVKLGLKNQSISASSQYVKTYWGLVNGTNSSGEATQKAVGGPENVVTRFAIQLPSITVLPAAFITMKVLPYTIVYRPPGDRSTATFVTTNSYGTSLTTGTNTAIDNTTAFMQSMGIENNLSVSALIATVAEQGGETSSSTNATDINGTIGTGLVTSSSHTVQTTWTVGETTADPTIFPASPYVLPATCTKMNYSPTQCSTTSPAETYFQEPFWQDKIILMLNPTAEVWNFNGGTSMQLLGAVDTFSITVQDLYTCALNSSAKAWKLPNGTYLKPSECNDLLKLDPFYVEGQEYDPSQTNRGVRAGETNYGADPLSDTSAPGSVALQNVIATTSTQSTSAAASYQSTVTSVVGFSWSSGLTLAAKYSAYGLNVGISDGTTVTGGYQNTNGTQMKVSYTASTAATNTSTTSITGTLSDDHDFYTPACHADSGKCYVPEVNIYLDELFGSYMFSDPQAAAAPKLTIIHRSPYIPYKLKAGVK